MKRLGSLILMKICLVSLLIVAPAGAAISPTNQMTGWTDGSSIHLEVYDPKINANWIYMYSMGTSITNFNISNGIARWCEGSQVGTEYKGYIFHVLFDPAPDRGWMLNQSNYFDDLVVNTLTESNGIVSGVGWRNFGFVAYFSTYDPVKGKWIAKDSNDFNNYPFLVNQDGIVTVSDPSWQWVKCYIYDNTPGRLAWQEKTLYPVAGSSIEQATVKVDFGGATTYWGYKPLSGTWEEGQSLSKACIYTHLTRGSPPLWVWFWDLSLAAVTKQWTFGDGPSVYGGSCGHNYPNVGTYKVTQLVAGYPAGGADATSTYIYVLGPGIPPSLPLLLLD
jgi:hypothetical protein